MVFSIALAVAMSFEGANRSCPSADVLFTCQAPAPQGQQQDPIKPQPIFNPPAAPLGETGPDAEAGGNPAPIPTTKYFLDSYNVLFQHQLVENWNYVLDATYGRAADTAGTSDDTNWVGFANYLSHNINEQTVLNLRAEWFRDADGARTGTRGSYVAVTVGAQWSPMEWLMVRPFLRFDRNSNGPFEGDDDMLSGGLEAVLRW